MKKFITLLLVLTGMVCTVSADGLTVYLKANGWTTDLAKFAVFAQGEGKDNTTINFGIISDDYYSVDVPEGYTTITLIRHDPAKDLSGQDFLGNYWNISGTKTISASNNYFIFSNDWSGDSGNSVFTETAAHKIYVKNKQTEDTPKLYAWDGSNKSLNGDWPGRAMTADGDWYSWLNLSGETTVNGLFDLTGPSDQCGDISFDLSSSDAYYYYYPNYQVGVAAEDALTTPAKVYVQANVEGTIKMYHWGYPEGASWYGSPLTLTKETVNGKDWYTFETPLKSFSGQFFTYDNGGDDHNKTATRDFAFTSGENAYFFANISTQNLQASKFESKYYIVYRSKSNWDGIDIDNTGNSYIEMTKDDDFTFKGTIDNLNGNNVIFLIAPESAVSIDGDEASITNWGQCFFFDGSDYYGILWQNMHDNLTTASWKRWKIDASSVKAIFDITFDFENLTFDSNPYFERTINPSIGFATFSSAYNVAIPEGVTAWYAKEVTDGKVVMKKFENGIASGQGVLLQGAGDVKFTPATSTDNLTSNLLYGTVEDTPLTGNSTAPYQYILGGNNSEDVGFYYVNTNRTSLAGKAYLRTEVSLHRNASGARAAWVFDDDDVVTGINEVKNTKAAEGYYNIAGQRVAQPTKGLYIVNGKKVIIK